MHPRVFPLRCYSPHLSPEILTSHILDEHPMAPHPPSIRKRPLLPPLPLLYLRVPSHNQLHTKSDLENRIFRTLHQWRVPHLNQPTSHLLSSKILTSTLYLENPHFNSSHREPSLKNPPLHHKTAKKKTRFISTSPSKAGNLSKTATLSSESPSFLTFLPQNNPIFTLTHPDASLRVSPKTPPFVSITSIHPLVARGRIRSGKPPFLPSYPLKPPKLTTTVLSL